MSLDCWKPIITPAIRVSDPASTVRVETHVATGQATLASPIGQYPLTWDEVRSLHNDFSRLVAELNKMEQQALAEEMRHLRARQADVLARMIELERMQ